MNEDEFWTFISMISQKALLRGEETKAVEKLSNVLTRLSKSELESFQKLFAQMLDRIDDKSYRNECPGSQSDDTFLYARCFVIGRGREHFYKVLHNPKLMPKGEESFEHLLQLIDDIEVDDDFLKLGPKSIERLDISFEYKNLIFDGWDHPIKKPFNSVIERFLLKLQELHFKLPGYSAIAILCTDKISEDQVEIMPPDIHTFDWRMVQVGVALEKIENSSEDDFVFWINIMEVALHRLFTDNPELLKAVNHVIEFLRREGETASSILLDKSFKTATAQIFIVVTHECKYLIFLHLKIPGQNIDTKKAVFSFSKFFDVRTLINDVKITKDAVIFKSKKGESASQMIKDYSFQSEIKLSDFLSESWQPIETIYWLDKYA
ncbi:DUF4240 domain-containing protein [bacterium]|nr:DUF4240 domain-containing protein [bacterium]QQR57713.1 MAG: DUF4240 domain-containing protein [Candidatus Melainabacteria bacterium]